ncbi:segregation/condensation protein A [Enterococcus timonensis]|uniref:segregation/condensation protein A n=1 Tax=Enterococcus timonensis TaxID=1852364 RepID=UPI0008D9DC09|nr:segregation/condensation protein A [Enterococcus timonensis]
MTDLNVKIEGFEGPMDLLLHLIQQYEVDIYEVPLAEVCDQYLNYVHTMHALQLEVAAEYLVVAATLLAIKSRQLLPQIENENIDELWEEDTGLDPKEELLQQLLVYRKFKYAGQELQDLEGQRQLFFEKEPSDLSMYTKDLPLEKNQVTTIDLFLAFHDVLQKKQEQTGQQATVAKEDLSVSQKVSWFKRHLFIHTRQVSFSDMFVNYEKNELVNTFLAVLELLKEGFMTAMQAENFADIYFEQREESRG